MNQPPKPFPRLRVMHCITRLGLGGAERVAFSLVRELRNEIDFAVFTVHGCSDDALGPSMRDELREAQVPWFQGTRVPMKAGGMVPGGLALARAAQAFRPDIVHFHSETPEACGAVMMQVASRKAGVLVRTIHNSIFWRYWPRVGRWCDRRLASAHIACVSEGAREEFFRYRRDSGARAAPSEPVVIYNGVPTSIRPPRPGPLSPETRRVLFAGRFEDQKGTDLLCQAIPATRLPPGTTGELTIVGHGAHEPLLRAFADRPPANWRIEIRNTVPTLEDVFPQFDLVVMPSRFEGLGLVAIEATLAGLPVVITDALGLREALPADYPWRAVPGDHQSLARALAAALAETQRWPEVVRAGQRFAQARFSPRAMRDSYFQLYASAAGHPTFS
jgi:glycosyltransferase involved in cell wall biosynthesis